MKKVIGVVSEGPTDYLVIKTIVDLITNEDNDYLRIQPESSMDGKYGNGWKGVWKWCNDHLHLKEYIDGINPKIDLIIVQMDGDVMRKEREVHCFCDSNICEEKGKDFPLFCEKAKIKCPIVMPCKNHDYSVEEIIKFEQDLIMNEFEKEINNRVIINIPCDTTDAWIVASYDKIDDIEKIDNPYDSIISKKKYYHDIRVRGDKKSVKTYELFLPKLKEKWDIVKSTCYSARIFDQDIKNKLLNK